MLDIATKYKNNARSALIELYFRDVGQIGKTVGSRLNSFFVFRLYGTTCKNNCDTKYQNI
jgi:hypothetical protein